MQFLKALIVVLFEFLKKRSELLELQVDIPLPQEIHFLKNALSKFKVKKTTKQNM